MESVTLGRTDLLVSRLGFGCRPFGDYGWVEEALDRGVNFFDTADVDGEGRSEELLGRALKGKRDRAVIATKFGVRLGEDRKGYHDNSARWLNEALEGSLRRLQVDCIDLYQVHYRDGVTPLENLILNLERKRREGKIRYYGLSNPGPAELSTVMLPSVGASKTYAVLPAPGLVSFQMEMSLANRRHEGFIRDAVRRKGWTFLSWGSLGQGVLTGKYDLQTRFDPNDRGSRDLYVNFHGDKLARNLAIVEILREMSGRLNRSLPAIALRWILDTFENSVVLTGIKTPGQLAQNAEALGWQLPEEDLATLNAISGDGPPVPPVDNKLRPQEEAGC